MLEVGNTAVLFLAPWTTGKHFGKVQLSIGTLPSVTFHRKLFEIGRRLVKVCLNSEGPI